MAVARQAEPFPLEAPLLNAMMIGWIVVTLTTFVAECLFLVGLWLDLSWPSAAENTRIELAAIAAFIATTSGLISLMLAAAAYKYSSVAPPWQVGWASGIIGLLGISTSLAYVF